MLGLCSQRQVTCDKSREWERHPAVLDPVCFVGSSTDVAMETSPFPSCWGVLGFEEMGLCASGACDRSGSVSSST